MYVMRCKDIDIKWTYSKCQNHHLKSDHERTTIKIWALMVVARWCHSCLPSLIRPPLGSHSSPSQLFHHLIWCFIDLFSLLLVLASLHGVNKYMSQGQQRMAGGRIARVQCVLQAKELNTCNQQTHRLTAWQWLPGVREENPRTYSDTLQFKHTR